MKQLVGLFIIIFLSIAVAEMISGTLLTMIYMPSIYSTETIALGSLLKYTISALTITVVLSAVYKINRALGI